MQKRQMLSRVIAITTETFGSDQIGDLAAPADDATCASDGRSIAFDFRSDG